MRPRTTTAAHPQNRRSPGPKTSMLPAGALPALGSKNTTWPRSSSAATLRLSVCHSLAMMATRLVVRNSCGMRWRRRAGVSVCQLSHLKRSLCVRHLSKANRPSRQLAAPSASTTCRASQHLHSDEHRIPLSQVVNPRVGALRPLPRASGRLGDQSCGRQMPPPAEQSSHSPADASILCKNPYFYCILGLDWP